jgi:primosomal protein N' (replication factor Y)
MPNPERATDRAALVALPVPVDRLFDYAVPADLDAAAQPGCRVMVPFGQRRLSGVIVERRLPVDPGRLRSLQRVLDPEPVVSPSLIQILRDLAAEVFCPVGIALSAALPAGTAPRAQVRWALTPRGRAAVESGALRGPLRAVAQRLLRGDASPDALRRVDPRAADHLRSLARDGLALRREQDSATPGPACVRMARPTDDIDAETLATELERRAPRQAAVLRLLAEAGTLPAAEVNRRVGGTGSALRALERSGRVSIQEIPATPDVLGTPLEPAGPALELTTDQAAALEPVIAAVRERRSDTFLLHGVTGSGKTEIYLRAVAEALRSGRQAIVLVPEITLTHQILARLRARFGDGLAVLHSGLRPGERWDQWTRLRRGSTPIAVGARSALFAPLDDLGLVVIDEEHDGAYKNEEGLRYHARDLAERRARAAGCPVLLGSATPSVETRYAADQGRMQLLTLPHRIGGRPLPAVEIVDLERVRAAMPRGRKLILTAPLRRALRETLAQGGQSLLLLNRRGFSTKVFCFECGHAERCEHCDIALVFHTSDQRMRCHYCDFEMAPPDVCLGCGAPDTALLGIGTQRVEEELRAAFPEARIARLDRDTATRRGTTESILRRLREGHLDVVVGTQMVAKGHDFPGVRLVGVVLADLGLHIPDFRAAERTFQLLTQVAGRAGRGSAPGRVVVQTFSPQHYAVAAVRGHDYAAFYAEELRQRQALGYPPFGRLLHGRVSGPELDAVRGAAERLAKAAGEAGGDTVEVLGPAPSPLARLRDRYRFQLLVRSADEPALRRAGRAMADAAVALSAPLRAVVDPNPLNML